MKSVLIFGFAMFIICSCSTYIPTYKFISYANQKNEPSTFMVNINSDKDVEIKVYGPWKSEYNLFYGYKSWFPSITHAKNAIENGKLAGSWLDSCKNLLVIWRSDDSNYTNARIDIMKGPEDIFVTK